MNSGKQHIDEELLIRFIIGEIDDAESAKVRDWINQSDENQAQLDQLEKVWAAAAPPGKIEPANVNADTAWLKMKVRIDGLTEIEDKHQSKQRSLLYYLPRIAAVLVVGVFIYWIYNYQKNQADLVQIASADAALTNNSLPDGTVISLNQNSILEFEKEFTDDERRVKLSGEAFFDVEPDADRPFIVEAKEAVITVLGTSFNVKALDEDKAVEVLVEEGLVELATSDKSQFVHLKIGEKGIYLKEQNEVKKETDIDVESLYWLNKTLLFRDTELSVVFKTLERLYDVTIEVNNEQILKCKLTAKFSNETIDHIIDHISVIFELEKKKEDNVILISGNGCQ